MDEQILSCEKCVYLCLLTLWSHDKLVCSILRVLEGDDGEETHLSGTSGTEKKQHFIRVSVNRKRDYCRPLVVLKMQLELHLTVGREKLCWLVLQ